MDFLFRVTCRSCTLTKLRPSCLVWGVGLAVQIDAGVKGLRPGPRVLPGVHMHGCHVHTSAHGLMNSDAKDRLANRLHNRYANIVVESELPPAVAALPAPAATFSRLLLLRNHGWQAKELREPGPGRRR